MTRRSIPRELRRQLLAEAGGRCAYCRTPTSISGARLVVDHIVPEAAGGQTKLDNLCLPCHSCNEFKGAEIAGQDPVTREVLPLFHPRSQRWSDHFFWSPDGTEIIGTTAIGRATSRTLKMNNPLIVQARRLWVAVGAHPPEEDL
ncbi:MAG: HNH endonuclease signature motif containing protein [Planctomycetota bacterium]|nr:HNH endonuclease signature motif containing protein [Planctomycetota bacterium]